MLQIVEADNFYTGNQTLKLQYDGFKIELVDEYPSLCEFNVKGFYVYNKLRSTETTCRPINRFLSTLSLDEQEEVANAMVLMSGRVREVVDTVDEVEAIMDDWGEVIDSLDESIGLCDKILAWINDGNIQISDMSTAGSGPHHSVDMTFKKDEAAIITSIMILGKLMIPLVGEFILRQSSILNNKFVESVACSMYTPLFKRKFEAIIQKIDHYTDSLVSNKAKNEPGIHYRGATPDTLVRTIKGDFFIKKPASIDLDRPNGNVIKYLASCIKNALDGQTKNSGNRYSIKLFMDPKDGDIISGTEETNSSRVEIESTASRKPMLSPPASRFAVKWVIKHTLETEDLDKEMYDEMCRYYEQNPMMVTPITLFILATYFGPEIGGGHSIYLLDAPLTIKLAALLQMIAMKQGADALAHMLTMKISSESRLGQASDFTFANAWRASPEYTNCRKTVSNGFGEISWDVKLREIADTLTSKTFLYHSSPVVWAGLEQENNNGSALGDPLTFMLQLLVLIRNLWKQRSLQNDIAD